MKNLIITAVAALLTSTAAFAHDYKVGGLTVMHPKTFETAKNANVGGGYMIIENTSDTADKLVAVHVAEIPRIGLHLSETDANGVARMIRQDGVPIPAGETIMFKPGGLHIMFMGLGGDPFEVGEKIKATLVFETAGELDVVFNVEARSADNHSDMKHSDEMKTD